MGYSSAGVCTKADFPLKSKLMLHSSFRVHTPNKKSSYVKNLKLGVFIQAQRKPIQGFCTL